VRYTRRVRWVLECDTLGKRFGVRWVFRGLSLRAETGNVVVVQGGNGSGKSTLLRIVAGLTAPTEGRVILRYGAQAVATRMDYLGWCATDGALYRELTAYEHLAWWATVRGGTPSREALLEWLARFELAERAHERVRAFSTGMRQRLRLALATWGQPPLLLLDEPDAGMDSSGLALLERVLYEQRTFGLALFATNRAEHARWGDLVLEMGA